MLRDHCIFCWEKTEERIWFNVICLKLYQFERTTWWCLSVMEFALQFVLKSVLLKKNIEKHGLPKFASGLPLGGGPDENSGRPRNLILSPPCRTPCITIHP